MSEQPGKGNAPPYFLLITQGNFDVLLTVHLSTILVINHLNTKILVL
jgi:hypothetical protein